MAENTVTSNTSNIPIPSRHITTHDATNGLSIFSRSLPSTATFQPINSSLDFFVAYTDTSPPDLNDFADLSAYTRISENPGTLPLTIPNGTVLRVCNFAPDSITGMHRTVSLDFGIVVAGEVELVLDSGETRLLKVGDIAVQRATLHAWRNPSQSKSARMVFILQDAKPLVIAGKGLGADHGGIGE